MSMSTFLDRNLPEVRQLSIVIPAHNEEQNIVPCLEGLLRLLVEQQRIDLEIIVVADGCQDGTEDAVLRLQEKWPQVRLVRHNPPCGFGRALRCGLNFIRGEVVIIYMADLSDSPEDALAYYRTIQEGYDCVYGSRFVPGGGVSNYPRVKLIVNRIVNTVVRILFWTRFNDLTNAFKAYRRQVVESCGPYRSSHFNITLEMSLSALISGYRIRQIPIQWEGRTWGSTSLRMTEMGRRYLCTLMMLLFQRVLISDDIHAERGQASASGQELFGSTDKSV